MPSPTTEGDTVPSMANADVETASVTLMVAATNDHISYARLTATALAGKMGFDYDAIEDIRIAVSELCSNVIACAITGSELTLSLRGDAEGITVTGRVPVSDAAPPLDPDELSEQVLDAVVDTHRYSVDGTEIQFTMFRGHRPNET
jgi:histidine kinase-like protein